jgi:CxxC-x17-CxxC domain-containing protein
MDGERQMFQGNWTCANCGKDITELPFEPRSTDNLMCRDCHRESRPKRDRGERKMYEGNWTCADCGGAITSLPFEPRETNNLKCRDCFKKDRN